MATSLPPLQVLDRLVVLLNHPSKALTFAATEALGAIAGGAEPGSEGEGSFGGCTASAIPSLISMVKTGEMVRPRAQRRMWSGSF